MESNMKNEDTIIYTAGNRADFDKNQLHINTNLDIHYAGKGIPPEIHAEVIRPSQVIQEALKKLTPIEKACILKIRHKIKLLQS